MTSLVSAPEVPAGFVPLDVLSAFPNAVGAFYLREDAAGQVVAVRAEARHANAYGGVHGGFLLTLVDIALTYRRGVTLSLTTDFAGAARVGDWIEAHVDVQKTGKSTIFANCFVFAHGERIMHASGVFRLPKVAPVRPTDA